MHTLTKIARFTTNKDGDALVTRDGRPYTSVRIKTKETGDKWISGFGNPKNESWKEGDTVDIIVTEKGEYLNFTMPKPADISNEKLEQILNKITTLTLRVNAIAATVDELAKNNKTNSYPTPDEEGIDITDVPF